MTTDEELVMFCRNVRYLREKFGLSKSRMAKILGIGVKGLTMMEKEIFPPRTGVECLIRLSAFFGLHPGSVFQPLWERN